MTSYTEVEDLLVETGRSLRGKGVRPLTGSIVEMDNTWWVCETCGEMKTKGVAGPDCSVLCLSCADRMRGAFFDKWAALCCLEKIAIKRLNDTLQDEEKVNR